MRKSAQELLDGLLWSKIIGQNSHFLPDFGAFSKNYKKLKI
jgi:hypothetical protein